MMHRTISRLTARQRRQIVPAAAFPSVVTEELALVSFRHVEAQFAWIKPVSVNPVDANIRQPRTQSTP